jgi:ABC-type spermidine/putrescine transport system permease subunit II
MQQQGLSFCLLLSVFLLFPSLCVSVFVCAFTQSCSHLLGEVEALVLSLLATAVARLLSLSLLVPLLLPLLLFTVAVVVVCDWVEPFTKTRLVKAA